MQTLLRRRVREIRHNSVGLSLFEADQAKKRGGEMIRERKRAAGRLRRVLKCVGPLLLAVGSPALAQQQEQLGWGVDLGARYTDNVGRQDVNEESETVGIAGVRFNFDVDRRRLDGHAAADLRYQKYFDDTFDNEVAGGLDALLSFAFVPERFLWVVADNYGQVANNRQAVDNPDNRQDINYFSTGPDINIGLGTRTTLQLSGRWEDAYIERTDQDNETVLGSAALARQLSAAATLSLNYSTSEVDFDDDTQFFDYTEEQAFLRLALTGSRTTLTLDGGGSRVEQDDIDSKQESLLARLQLTREVGVRSQMRLVVGTTPSNTAQAFRRDQENGGVDVGPEGAIAAGDSFQQDYAYLTFTTEWDRGGLTALLSARSDDHDVQSDLDREQYRGTLTLARDLTRSVTMDVHGTYLDEKFTESGFSFDEWGAGLGLRWEISRQFSMRLRADHFVGSSDDGSRDYTENRAYIGFTYSSSTAE
jgi:hypothetical protein